MSLQSVGGSCLPAEIWQDQPSTAQANDAEPAYSIENLAGSVYAAATNCLGLSESGRKLDLEGTGMALLIARFEEVLANAVTAGDYTSILLPDRTFTV